MKLFEFLVIASIASIAFAGTSGPAPVPNPPSWHISSPATYVCSGQVNMIPVTVYNAPSGTATTMQDVQLSIPNSKLLSPVNNVSIDAGNINVNTSKTVDLPVLVSLNASLFLNTAVNINYYYDTLYSDSETGNLTFEVKECASPLTLSVTPHVLTKGTIENLSINFTNTGNTNLTDVLLRYQAPNQEIEILGNQPVEVTSIPAHGKVLLNQSIFVYSNASETFPLNLTVVFYNATAVQEVKDTVPLLSTGLVNLSATTFTVSPTIPTPDSYFSISFILTDIGTSSVSALTVTPVYPKGFSAYSSNSDFVGDVSQDTQTSVTLTFRTSNSVKPGNYIIPIQVSYLNNIRQNVTKTINTSVTIASGSGLSAFNSTGAAGYRTRSSGSGLLLPIIVVIVIIVVAYFLWKRGQTKKKAAK